MVYQRTRTSLEEFVKKIFPHNREGTFRKRSKPVLYRADIILWSTQPTWAGYAIMQTIAEVSPKPFNIVSERSEIASQTKLLEHAGIFLKKRGMYTYEMGGFEVSFREEDFSRLIPKEETRLKGLLQKLERQDPLNVKEIIEYNRLLAIHNQEESPEILEAIRSAIRYPI